MNAGVEFVDTDQVSTFRGASLEYYDLRGKRVAFLSAPDTGFLKYVLEQCPSTVVLYQRAGHEVDFGANPPAGAVETEGANPEPATCLIERPMTGCCDWSDEIEPFDFAFFDRDQAEDFDDVTDAQLLSKWLIRNLSASGVCFALLRTGMVQTDWDVFNSIVLSPDGRLPTSPYFYERTMAQFAVRPLVRVQDPLRRFSVSRVFRLARRSQTLLLVVGHSQAGKTTLARELRANSAHSHLASDYIFYNLFQLRAEANIPGRGEAISEILGSGSAEATGNFFRQLEEDDAILFEYLDTAHYLLPSEPNIVSMDIDLRMPVTIQKARTYMADKGYNVWIVSRDVCTIVVERESAPEVELTEENSIGEADPALPVLDEQN